MRAMLQVPRLLSFKSAAEKPIAYTFPNGVPFAPLHRFTRMKNDFKGNKQCLPSKPCLVCGRTMTWRKAWAKNWAEVRYCSDACRARKGTVQLPDSSSHG